MRSCRDVGLSLEHLVLITLPHFLWHRIVHPRGMNFWLMFTAEIQLHLCSDYISTVVWRTAITCVLPQLKGPQFSTVVCSVFFYCFCSSGYQPFDSYRSGFLGLPSILDLVKYWYSFSDFISMPALAVPAFSSPQLSPAFDVNWEHCWLLLSSFTRPPD